MPCLSICSSIYFTFKCSSSSVVFFLKNGLTGSYFSFGGVSVMIGLFAIFMPFSFAPLKADLSDKLSKLDP